MTTKELKKIKKLLETKENKIKALKQQIKDLMGEGEEMEGMDED